MSSTYYDTETLFKDTPQDDTDFSQHIDFQQGQKPYGNPRYNFLECDINGQIIQKQTAESRPDTLDNITGGSSSNRRTLPSSQKVHFDIGNNNNENIRNNRNKYSNIEHFNTTYSNMPKSDADYLTSSNTQYRDFENTQPVNNFDNFKENVKQTISKMNNVISNRLVDTKEKFTSGTFFKSWFMIIIYVIFALALLISLVKFFFAVYFDEPKYRNYAIQEYRFINLPAIVATKDSPIIEKISEWWLQFWRLFSLCLYAPLNCIYSGVIKHETIRAREPLIGHKYRKSKINYTPLSGGYKKEYIL